MNKQESMCPLQEMFGKTRNADEDEIESLMFSPEKVFGLIPDEVESEIMEYYYQR